MIGSSEVILYFRVRIDGGLGCRVSLGVNKPHVGRSGERHVNVHMDIPTNYKNIINEKYKLKLKTYLFKSTTSVVLEIPLGYPFNSGSRDKG